MDNKQTPIINQIKSALSDFEVGEYPFDVAKYVQGDWDSVALIQDGDEVSLDDERNKAILKEYNISIWLYSNNKLRTIEHLLDLQAQIEDAILDDVTLSNTAWCIDIESIEKGSQLEDFTGYEPGYLGNKSCRKLNFRAKFEQVR